MTTTNDGTVPDPFEQLTPAERAEAEALTNLLAAPLFGAVVAALDLRASERIDEAEELEEAVSGPMLFETLEIGAVPFEVFRVCPESPILRQRFPVGLLWVCDPGASDRIVPAALAALRLTLEQGRGALLADGEGADEAEAPCPLCASVEAEDWGDPICGHCEDALGALSAEDRALVDRLLAAAASDRLLVEGVKGDDD